MYFSNPCHLHTNSNSGRPCFAVSPAFCITTGALPIPHTYSNPLVSRLAARATLLCNLTDCLVSWQGDEMLPEPQCDEISNPGVLPPKGILSQRAKHHRVIDNRTTYLALYPAAIQILPIPLLGEKTVKK
ncbi:hypothetical protein V8C40DRAFT_51621 [Trichoderma camerunense]